MIAIVQLEKWVTGAGVLRIIISTFSNWEEPGPIILLEINKDPEVGLHGVVLLFCLTISLRVKSSEEHPLNSKEVA